MGWALDEQNLQLYFYVFFFLFDLVLEKVLILAVVCKMRGYVEFPDIVRSIVVVIDRFSTRSMGRFS
jgi:hypothetical protein